jgi:tetratricopeptide (TPR) repeat protein
MRRTSFLIPLLLPLVSAAQADRAVHHMEQARSAYAAARYDEALLHADSALAVNEAVAGGYKLRGDIRQRKADLHGALLDYVKAEKYDDRDPRLFVSRSAIHVTEGRVKEALRDADRALALDKNDADAWYNRGCAGYLGQDMNGALRDLDRSLELNPNNAFALMLRGVVNGALFNDREGLSDLRAAAALDANLPGVRMSLGVQLFEAKQYQEAIGVFTEVIAAGGDGALVEAYYYRADCHYNLDDKEKACADWRAAGEGGDKDAQFIMRNYCNTDEEKIPRKPVKQRKTVIEF